MMTTATSTSNTWRSSSESLRPRTCVLKAYEGHGAYAWHLGDFYFLAAAELNAHVPPGATLADPEVRLRAATAVIAEIEADPRAMTPLGSFRFNDVEEYRRHRRALAKAIRLFRSALKLKQKAEALPSAR